MNHPHVILRRAYVAGILEGDPRMPGLVQHGQHLAPERLGLDALEQAHLTLLNFLFIGAVALLEVAAKGAVEIRDLIGREQRPTVILDDPLHEQVGNPVGRVSISWVRRRSSPVFLRRSRKSSMS